MQAGTAVDISNYTGELGATKLEWLAENAQLVIVRLSTEDNRGQRAIAAQQVQALADRGIPWQGYLWCYWDQDPFDHWWAVREKLPPGWPGYYGLGIWMDAEDTADKPQRTLEWVNSYASLLRADGFVPGVYTGRWWVDQHHAAFVGGRQDYWAQYPLWFAHYGVGPSCAPPGIEPWTEVAMHQYRAVDSGPVLNSYDLSQICRVP